jgi:hypothetical protein
MNRPLSKWGTLLPFLSVLESYTALASVYTENTARKATSTQDILTHMKEEFTLCPSTGSFRSSY